MTLYHVNIVLHCIPYMHIARCICLARRNHADNSLFSRLTRRDARLSRRDSRLARGWKLTFDKYCTWYYCYYILCPRSTQRDYFAQDPQDWNTLPRSTNRNLGKTVPPYIDWQSSVIYVYSISIKLWYINWQPCKLGNLSKTVEDGDVGKQ